MVFLRTKFRDPVLLRKKLLEGHRWTPQELLAARMVDDLVHGGSQHILTRAVALAETRSENAMSGVYGLIKVHLRRQPGCPWTSDMAPFLFLASRRRCIARSSMRQNSTCGLSQPRRRTWWRSRGCLGVPGCEAEHAVNMLVFVYELFGHRDTSPSNSNGLPKLCSVPVPSHLRYCEMWAGLPRPELRGQAPTEDRAHTVVDGETRNCRGLVADMPVIIKEVTTPYGYCLSVEYLRTNVICPRVNTNTRGRDADAVVDGEIQTCQGLLSDNQESGHTRLLRNSDIVSMTHIP